MSKGAKGLPSLAEEVLREDGRSGAIFVFGNKPDLWGGLVQPCDSVDGLTPRLR